MNTRLVISTKPACSLVLNLAAIMLFLVTGCFAQSGISANSRRLANELAAPAPVVVSPDGLRLAFAANNGQAKPGVLFHARGQGYAVALTDTGATVSLQHAANCATRADGQRALPNSCVAAPPNVVRLSLDGTGNPSALNGAVALATPQLTGESPLPGKVNYLIGNDPARWRTGLPTYAKVRYSDAYPGIDLVFYGNQGRLEFDFVVAPGADPERIRLHLDGADKVALDPAGNLLIYTSGGQLSLQTPTIYQEEQGRRRPIDGRFIVYADGRVGFHLPRYNHAEPLVIDPVLNYGTYLGGSASESANAIAVDSAGSAYVTGTTFSADFPIANPHSGVDPNPGKPVVFVTKLNPDGSGLVYSTYLGGTGGDYGNGIAVDATGAAYLVGTTGSPDFPMANPIQSTFATSTDAFVTKLDPTGSNLVFSTFLGGTGLFSGDFCCGSDSGGGIALDSNRNVYVTGTTFSADFPVVNPVQPQNNAAGNGSNAFLTKINAAGTAIVFSTYLGGSGNFSQYYYDFPLWRPSNGDYGAGIAVDAQGEAIVTGITFSNDFPMQSAIQSQNHAQFSNPNRGIYYTDSNLFVTKFKADGSGYVFSTYLGGGGFSYDCLNQKDILGDTGGAVAVDSSGNVYVTGAARSGNFPTTPAITISGFTGTGPGNSGGVGVISETNAFVTALKADGSSFLFSTYLAGPATDTCQWEFDWDHQMLNCPSHSPTAAPWICGIQSVPEYDGDAGRGIAIGADGTVYVAGSSGSVAFPVKNASQSVNRAFNVLGSNAFLTAIKTGATPSLLYSTYYGGSTGDTALGVATDSTGGVYVAGQTRSADLTTTPNAFDTTLKGGSDAFVAKFNVGIVQTLRSNLPQSVVYGAPQIDLSQSIWATSGLRVSFSLVSGPATLNGSILKVRGVGAVVVNAALGGDSTHAPAQLQSTLQVLPATLTVTAKNYAYSYGQTPVAPTAYQISGFVNGESASVVTGAPVLSTTMPLAATTPVGTYPLLVSPGTLAAANYIFQGAQGTVYVLPVALVVVPKNQGIVYGQKPPVTLPYTLTGFVNGDTPSVVSGAPVITSAVTSTTPVGSYPIDAAVGTLASANYRIFTNRATFVVSRAQLTVAAKSYGSHYGQAPAPPTAYLLSGFIYGETASVVTGAPILSTKVTARSPVGTYPIQVAVGTLKAANYIIAPGGPVGSVIVQPALLIVAPKNQSTIYGQAPPQILPYSLTGFVNGDTAGAVSGAPVIKTAANAATPVGTYPITAAVGTLKAANYNIYANPGQIVVNKATLVATAASLTMKQGGPLPALTYSLAGFANGDTAAAVSGAPVLTTTATTASKPGKYPITLVRGSLAATNYNFSAVNGVLTITQ